MNLLDSIEFPDLAAADLEAYARKKAASSALDIPPIFLSGVLENLTALQSHAAILAASLDARDPAPSGPSA